jgi:desampylase
VRLKLSPSVAADVIAAVVDAGDREVCAALLGEIAPDDRVFVSAWLKLRNVDGRPGRFAVPDSELRRARAAARAHQLEVVGWLHSHPSGCSELSVEDLEALAQSSAMWVVCVLEAAEATFHAYRAPEGARLPVD